MFGVSGVKRFGATVTSRRYRSVSGVIKWLFPRKREEGGAKGTNDLGGLAGYINGVSTQGG